MVMPTNTYEASRRHALHYLGVVDRLHAIYVDGDGSQRALCLFDQERPNIDLAYHWAARRSGSDSIGASICSRLAHNGSYLFNARLSAAGQVEWFQLAIVAARRSCNQHEEGAHLGNVGLGYQRLGD